MEGFMKKLIIGICFMLSACGAFLAKAVAPKDLFSVVQAGDRKAVKKMLLNGANVNALNAKGKTALDIAAERGNFKIARDLVSSGAKVTKKSNAAFLVKKFKSRALNFFISGFFVTPLLWIGSIVSLNKASSADLLIETN